MNNPGISTGCPSNFFLIDYTRFLSCQECTYSHFEKSSDCPLCARKLSENDFTELVVTDATSTSLEISKSSLQTLLSKSTQQNPNDGSYKALPLSDMCVSLIRQFDATKQSTRFLLKQLLMNTNIEGRKFLTALQVNETLKNEITNLKQAHATQRLQYEQLHTDMKNRLTARETTIQELNNALEEKDKLLEQFRRLHGNMVVPTPIDTSVTSRLDHGSHDVSRHHAIPPSGSSVAEPPLKGLLMQRQAQQVAQQQAFASSNRRVMPLQVNQGLQNSNNQGSLFGSLSSSAAPLHSNTMDSSSMGQPMIGYARPFTSTSTGSKGSLQGQAPAPRIRDITSNTGYKFTSIARNNSFNIQNTQRINKRRKSESPSSANGMMSPNTAFLLNQGPQSGMSHAPGRW